MTRQAAENLDRLVQARDQFEAALAVLPRLTDGAALALAALGRTLGVGELELCAGLGVMPLVYEPPRVTVVGNMHDLLQHVCPPKEGE